MAELLIAIRWLHVLFGTTWIGLLYSSNLREAQAAAPGGDSAANKGREPLWLGGFPWSAGGTVLFGVAYFTLVERRRLFVWRAPNAYEIMIITGSALGLAMFFNALVFWLARRRLVQKEAAGALAYALSAGPRDARRAMLATRTNVMLSIPMLFFMTAASHYRFLPHLRLAQTGAWFAIVGSTIAVLELNAIVGLGRTGQRLFETVRAAFAAGFALWGALFAISKLLFA